MKLISVINTIKEITFMKILKLLNYLIIAMFLIGSSTTMAQESFYELQSAAKVKTNDTRDQIRVGTCWSNAGAAFLEAEWLKTGKAPVDISVMNAVHDAYMEKASVFFESNDQFKVDPSGIAFDFISLTKKYGMAPENAYMYPESEMMNSREKEGEMDAVLRGTVNMVKQRGEEFTERWQNIYSTSLLRYMGETKINFDYNKIEYTPMTFAEYSGLSMDDYVLIGSDSKSKLNTVFDIDFKENWGKHQFYNVSLDYLTKIIQNGVENDYSVLWYGVVDDKNIFKAEDMALVPAGDMPGVKTDEEGSDETEYKPIAEKSITPEMRSSNIAKNISSEQDYLLIYGVNTDQDGKTYFEAKYVCSAGNKVLNLSVPYTQLNTIYLMMNKNGLPGTVKSSLGL